MEKKIYYAEVDISAEEKISKFESCDGRIFEWDLRRYMKNKIDKELLPKITKKIIKNPPNEKYTKKNACNTDTLSAFIIDDSIFLYCVVGVFYDPDERRVTYRYSFEKNSFCERVKKRTEQK